MVRWRSSHSRGLFWSSRCVVFRLGGERWRCSSRFAPPLRSAKSARNECIEGFAEENRGNPRTGGCDPPVLCCKRNKLHRPHASGTRVVDPKYAPGYKTTFSDGFPFTLISQGSLNKLNEFLEEPLPINRFRPNVLVDGCPPFSEDLWMTLTINKLTFHGVKLCSRCKVPTINQETGIAGAEPTPTLMKFRSDNALHRSNKAKGKVYFGQNLVCGESQLPKKGKMVKVGDPLYVLKSLSSVLDAPA